MVDRESFVNHGVISLEFEECGKDRPSDSAAYDDDFGLCHEDLVNNKEMVKRGELILGDSYIQWMSLGCHCPSPRLRVAAYGLPYMVGPTSVILTLSRKLTT